MNANGVIIVGGRLDYCISIPERARRPILLPSRHILSELIVSYHHQNNELIVNEIRRQFWIVNLRKAVSRAKARCQHCKNEMAKPVPPLMGQLPEDRVTPFQRPF